MHKTVAESIDFATSLAPLIRESQATVALAVPFTVLYSLKQLDLPIRLGAQNMHDAPSGAFTGEISASMLKEAGADFVLLGHSERRHVFDESNAFINRKVKRALEEGLEVTLCVGETLEQRERGEMYGVLKEQLLDSLADVKHLKSIMLAYEPVWAIGTGKVAHPDDAEEAHRYLRELIAEHWDEKTAEQIVIQYGGSVKPDNAQELLKKADLNGLLVGGASLTVESFSQIINQGCKS